MGKVEDIESAIERVYLEAYKPYAEGRIRELPRLDPNTGVLGELWKLWDQEAVK